jgi:cytochrome P450
VPLSPQCRTILEGSLFFHVALFNLEPPEQSAFRALISEWFAPRSLRQREAAMTELADGLVTELAGGGGADIMRQLAEPFSTTIVLDIIGIPAGDREQLMSWHRDWLLLQIVPMSEDDQARCARGVVCYEEYLRGQLERRTGHPADDLLSLLATAAAAPESALTMADAVVAVRVIIAAGHETVTGALGNTLLHLLSGPGLWARLTADPSLIPAAVEEGLRFDPPIQSLNRIAARPARVGDITIPAGARVCPVIAAVGRDPDRAASPDEFRLDREGPSRHIAFGSGAHFCIGAPLARLELRIALQALVRQLPGLALAPGFEPQHLPGGITFRRLAALPVTWPAPQPPATASSSGGSR